MLKPILISLSLAVSMVACTSQPIKQSTTAQTKAPTVSWPNFVKVINKGDYNLVSQQHDKTVRVVLDNNITLQSQEPYAGALFEVIENCEKCIGKPIVTE